MKLFFFVKNVLFLRKNFCVVLSKDIVVKRRPNLPSNKKVLHDKKKIFKKKFEKKT